MLGISEQQQDEELQAAEFYEHEQFEGVDGRLYGMHRVTDLDACEWREDHEIRQHFTDDGLFVPPPDVQRGARYAGESLDGGNVMFYAVVIDDPRSVTLLSIQRRGNLGCTRPQGQRVRRSRRTRRVTRRAARSPGGSDDEPSQIPHVIDAASEGGAS